MWNWKVYKFNNEPVFSIYYPNELLILQITRNYWHYLKIKGFPIIPILSQINQIPRTDTYFFQLSTVALHDISEQG